MRILTLAGRKIGVRDLKWSSLIPIQAHFAPLQLQLPLDFHPHDLLRRGTGPGDFENRDLVVGRISALERHVPPCPVRMYSTNDSVFVEWALSSIREFMEDDGQQFVYRRFIAPASGTVSFAKALNRSATGSMNELINHAVEWLADNALSPHDVGFKLNDILLSALATKKDRRHGRPKDQAAGQRTSSAKMTFRSANQFCPS